MDKYTELLEKMIATLEENNKLKAELNKLNWEYDELELRVNMQNQIVEDMEKELNELKQNPERKPKMQNSDTKIQQALKILKEPTCMKDLQSLLACNNNTANQILRQLEKHGYKIKRERKNSMTVVSIVE
jgi:Fic family protein